MVMVIASGTPDLSLWLGAAIGVAVVKSLGRFVEVVFGFVEVLLCISVPVLSDGDDAQGGIVTMVPPLPQNQPVEPFPQGSGDSQGETFIVGHEFHT